VPGPGLRRAARVLIPGEPAAADGARTATLLVGAALAAVAVWANLVRQPGSALDNLWAEDGRVFLTQGWRFPLWTTVGISPNGYLDLYPRVVAAVAAALPVGTAAVVMAAGGAAASGIAVLAVVIATEGHLPSLLARAGLGLAVALFPAAGFEIAANTANAHWYLVAASFFLLLWTPRSWVGTAAAALAVLAAAGSDPLAVLLAPIALIRLLARVRGSVVVVMALVVGLAIHLRSLLTHPIGPPAAGASAGRLGEAYLYRVVAVAVTGLRVARPPGPAVLAGSVAAVVVVTAAALLLTRRRTRTAALLAACLCWSVLMFVVPIRLRWSDAFLGAGDPRLGSRYVLLPWLLLLLAGAAFVDAITARWAARGPVAMLAGLAWPAAVLAICVPTFSAGATRAPSYTAQLPAARATCQQASDPAAVRIRGYPNLAWSSVLPCAVLQDGP